MSLQYRIVSVGIHPESYEILNRQLSPAEFTLQQAENYDQVKEILTQGVPDLFFLSLEFESLDPFKLCMALVKAGAAVLVVSSAPTRQLIIESAKHGAIDLLVSPFQPETLTKKIESALIKSGKKSLPEGLKLKLDFENAATSYEKVKVLIKKVENLLALPFSVVKIIKLCNDPMANTKDIEKPIKSDPAFTAMIMKRANSAAYAGMEPVKTIQRAIVRIGVRSTRNIAASFSVLKLFSKEDKNFGFNRTWFWVHSLTTGICAQLLATLFKIKHPEDAFLAGLIHDIGKMILDDFMNDEYHQALQKANTEGVSVREAEQSVFNVNHVYIGSKVAKNWQFPSTIVEAIEKHHNYNEPANENSSMSMNTVVCIANQMAKAIQAGHSGDQLAEVKALPLWRCLPSGVPWEIIIKKAFEEIKSFLELLEISPDQVQISTPEDNVKEIGIFLPNELNYGDLLQIALFKQGFKTVKFPSIYDPMVKEKKFELIIADLTHTEGDKDIKDLQGKISAISENNIILPPAREDGKPFSLDFFWLEKQLKKWSENQQDA